ncbi:MULTISPECIES: hypothetical protein [unclassified Streptomyces]|uniref:hypothetical protein n=1 Tax=unclassified Streptomyces TaxID=2593676 RepID=UPI00382271E7
MTAVLRAPSAVCFTAPAVFLAGGFSDAVPFEDAAFVTDFAFPEDADFFAGVAEAALTALAGALAGAFAGALARLFAGLFAGASTGAVALPGFAVFFAAFPALGDAAAVLRAGAEGAGRSTAALGAAFPRPAVAALGVAFFAVAFFVAVAFFPTMVAAPSHIVILHANRAGTINRPRTRGNGARRRIRPPCPVGRRACIRCAQLSARYSGTDR